MFNNARWLIMDYRKLIVRVPAELHQAVKVAAAQRDCSMNKLVVQAVARAAPPKPVKS